MASAIPAVKAAVLSTLSSAEDLEGVEVGADLEPSRNSKYVWIWRAKSKRQFKSVGARPPALDEDVSLTLRVVVIGGEDPETAVFEISDAVEAALRADLTLGGAVRWHRVEELDQEPLQFDQKVGCHILMTLTARARI